MRLLQRAITSTGWRLRKWWLSATPHTHSLAVAPTQRADRHCTGHLEAVKCTLGCRAPEAVCAQHSAQTPTLEPSLSAWVLGVMIRRMRNACECLTGTVVFPPFSETSRMHHRAWGSGVDPWEGHDGPHAWRTARLRWILEQCLHRQAQKRTNAPEVVRALRRLRIVTT